MVDFISFRSEPLSLFNELIIAAKKRGQKNVDAMCLSSIDHKDSTPQARFVNLKYVKDSKLIFFSNYNSNKSQQFQKYPYVSCTFFWSTIDVQIRINGFIEKTSSEFSDLHFSKRSKEKNALSIASYQSSKISSFDEVVKKFNEVLKKNSIDKRPSYWGGYSITPNYFEFWKGGNNRLNKREEFLLKEGKWIYSILEP
tara:strand:+ start:2395 stop:2988 length:594 start_codon:yes stop_codon:yes gene_type:complete